MTLSRRQLLGTLLAGKCIGSTFSDVTGASGLGAARNVSGDPRDKRYLIEEMGGGVALFDFDNDGWLDIFLVNGTCLEPGDARSSATSYLFKNNRDGTFTDVTRKAGLTRTGWGQGCCVGDFDNDGYEDLFVSYWGKNVLYRNNGDGTFTDISQKAGVAGAPDRWGAGCCFLDYDKDGFLDIFVANYVRFDPRKAPPPGASPLCRYNDVPVPCGPQGFAGGTNVLYRNRGDGTFEDVSERAGITNPRGAAAFVFTDRNWRPAGSYGMGAVAADFDNDGWTDIYVAGDSAPSLLYHNNGDGTFREVGVEAGAAFDENGVAMSGMGVGVADYDGDGWLDIARTNFSDQVTTIYRNNGDGTFHDASLAAGMGVNRKYLGFGVGFFDFDNDGRKDLFVANGHVYAQLAAHKGHVTYAQPAVLYRNTGVKFQDVSSDGGAATSTARVSRGCAFGDINNDGRIDIVLNNLDGQPTVLRNECPSEGRSVLLKLIGRKSNRSAIGARVRLTAGGQTQIDEVMSGSSYYSHNDLRLHFGLGQSAIISSLEVEWPSGAKTRLTDVKASQILVIEEGKGVVRAEPYRGGAKS